MSPTSLSPSERGTGRPRLFTLSSLSRASCSTYCRLASSRFATMHSHTWGLARPAAGLVQHRTSATDLVPKCLHLPPWSTKCSQFRRRNCEHSATMIGRTGRVRLRVLPWALPSPHNPPQPSGIPFWVGDRLGITGQTVIQAWTGSPPSRTHPEVGHAPARDRPRLTRDPVMDRLATEPGMSRGRSWTGLPPSRACPEAGHGPACHRAGHAQRPVMDRLATESGKPRSRSWTGSGPGTRRRHAGHRPACHRVVPPIDRPCCGVVPGRTHVFAGQEPTSLRTQSMLRHGAVGISDLKIIGT